MTGASGARPLIGITSYLDQASWGVWRQPAALLPHSYVTAVTAAGLMQAAVAKGLSRLYAELRALEDADRDCSKYPRVKTYDDASGVLIALDG